ncbi:hypothetical protein BDZ91DRAFT_51665 [Kalaharituber pfeilii]|nr:hypothetical protein BDZ91DRAFT_51665 [Kalaharituber pfeilii]
MRSASIAVIVGDWTSSEAAHLSPLEAENLDRVGRRAVDYRFGGCERSVRIPLATERVSASPRH